MKIPNTPNLVSKAAVLISPFILSACVYSSSTQPQVQAQAQPQLVSGCTSDKAYYVLGDVVQISCGASTSKNKGSGIVQIVALSGKREDDVHAIVTKTRDRTSGDFQFNWPVTQENTAGAYAIVQGAAADEKLQLSEADVFFRILNPDDITKYSIERRGGDNGVFALDAGLSAEYAVEKSLGSLTGTLTHSWDVSRSGHGPKPVFATRTFLKDAIDSTIDTYDKFLNADAQYGTVILSTGFPAVPYISQALGAPVLPLHFLASADSVTEIKGILDQAAADNHTAYATLGHDPSIDHAVAWIKLLDIPPEYLAFMKRRGVKNVLILGSTGVRDGETKAKRIGKAGSEDYRPGDIYIMYPGTSDSDEDSLVEKIHDLRYFPRSEEFVRITDWESGVADPQICRIKATASTLPDGGAKATAVTATDLIHMYDLATTVTAASMAKNRHLFEDATVPGSGIALNPYLMAYPMAEFREGYLPLVYFQVVPAKSTMARIDRVVRPALAKYFPKRDIAKSRIWVNSSKNFGGRFFGEPYEKELARLGYRNVRVNDYDSDEEWNPADANESIVEIIYADDLARPVDDRLKSWVKKHKKLSLTEFRKAASLHPEIIFDDSLCRK